MKNTIKKTLLLFCLTLTSCHQSEPLPSLEAPIIKEESSYYSSVRLKKANNYFSLPITTDRERKKEDITSVSLDNNPITEYDLTASNQKGTKYFLNLNIKEGGKYKEAKIKIGNKEYKYPVNLIVDDEKEYQGNYSFTFEGRQSETVSGLKRFTFSYHLQFPDSVELHLSNSNQFNLPQYKGTATFSSENGNPEKTDDSADLLKSCNYTLKIEFYEKEDVYFFDENIIFHIKGQENGEESAISLNNIPENGYSKVLQQLF